VKTKVTHKIVEAALDLDGSNQESENIINFFNQFFISNGIDNNDVVDAFKTEDLIEVILNDGESELALTFLKDDEDKKIYLKIGDVSGIENLPDGEIEVFDISDLIQYTPDFSLATLSPEFIDWLTDDDSPTAHTNEAFLTVIRGGKKVKKKLIRKKRRIRPNAKKRAGYKIAARKRKLHKAQSARKRKRSIAIRNRQHLKTKPKNMRLG
jgi:hypothetical protein